MPNSYPVVDPRQIGDVVAYGTLSATSDIASTTMTDARANWPVNKWGGCLVRIVNGPGKSQMRRCVLNTATVITIDDGWTVAAASGSAYVIVADPTGEGSVTKRLADVTGATATAGVALTGAAVSRGTRSFLAVLNVTDVPAGGGPTLDVYVQTLLPDLATWTDVAHITQVTGAVVVTLLAYPGPARAGAGTQAEGGAVTPDNFFAVEDAALTVSTVRLIPLGVQLRAKYVIAFAGGETGSYSFTLDIAEHD